MLLAIYLQAVSTPAASNLAVIGTVVALLAALLGSGFGAKLAGTAITEKMRQTFATKTWAGVFEKKVEKLEEKVEIASHERALIVQAHEIHVESVKRHIETPLRDLIKAQHDTSRKLDILIALSGRDV